MGPVREVSRGVVSAADDGIVVERTAERSRPRFNSPVFGRSLTDLERATAAARGSDCDSDNRSRQRRQRQRQPIATATATATADRGSSNDNG
jgi:hypothetical protein